MLQEAAIKRSLGVFLVCFSLSLFAAKDPVGWSLSPTTGFPATEIGQHSSVTYTLTNNLPFAAVMYTDSLTSNGTFHIYDQCKNVNLAPGQSCIVHVSFTPSQAGQATYQLIYGYHYNRIPLPILTINANGPANTESVVGYISDFPSLITLTPLETPQFTVTYVNRSSAAVTGYAGDSTGHNVFQIAPSIATVAVVSGSNNCGTGPGVTQLAYQGHCHVSGQITPSSTGRFTMTALYTYNTTQTVMPTASGLIQQNSSACGLTPSVELPLPTQTYPYADNVVKFQFTNQCASTPVSLGAVTVATGTGSVPATITQNQASVIYDTCSNKTLAGLEPCFVLASVVPNTTVTGGLRVKASVSNGYSTFEAHTSSTVVSNSTAGQDHQVHFINQCSFNVWYGIENGASGSVVSADPTPGAGTAGNDNAYFLAAAVPGQAPDSSTNGGIRNLAVSSYVNGSIWGRTGCAYATQSSTTQFACQTGMCNTLPSSATCVKSDSTQSVTPQNPFTKLEFSIVSAPGGDGVYDVSMINGFNISAEVKGLGPFVTGSPSKCTGAGAPLQQKNNQLGSCSWQFNPAQAPSNLHRSDFILVSPGPNTSCANDAACSGTPGTACGMGFGAVNGSFIAGPVFFNNTPPVNRLCGDFLGYSNLQNYQGLPSTNDWGDSTSYDLYNNYSLGTLLSTLGYSTYGTFLSNPATFGDMVACNTTSNLSLDTCYPNTGVVTNPDEYNFANCCGCVDWSLAGLTYNGGHTCPITVPNYPTPAVNTAWTQTAGVPATAENAIYWIKLACPTAYSFPFDDPSSSFTCTKDATDHKLNTDYDVVYCPGGLSGVPTGVTEGR